VTALPLEERAAVVRDRINEYNLTASIRWRRFTIEGETE